MKTSKFCAGATIDRRDVESIHPAIEIATTGTPAAFMANPEAEDWSQVDLWLGFGLMVFCFVVLIIEDKVRG